MAKPSITKRSVKGAALTYSELDTNFQNLADATLTLTAGSGGTAITADLNGTITLVAGDGISFAGDNTAKTITITGTASVTGLANPLNADLDLGNYKIVDSILATVESLALKIQNPTSPSTNSIQISPNSTGLFTIDCTTDRDLTIRTFDGGSVSSRITLDHNTGVNIGTGSITSTVSISGGALQFTSMTTTERNTITGVNGMVIYNNSTNKFQGYAGGTWVDLH